MFPRTSNQAKQMLADALLRAIGQCKTTGYDRAGKPCGDTQAGSLRWYQEQGQAERWGQNPDKRWPSLSPAEKQARHRQKKEEEGDRLCGLSYRLEAATWAAVGRGDVLADAVKARSSKGMIENLAAHFETAGVSNRATGWEREE